MIHIQVCGIKDAMYAGLIPQWPICEICAENNELEVTLIFMWEKYL